MLKPAIQLREPQMSLTSDPSNGLPSRSPRLRSIDIFRGITVVAMILVNAQFSADDSYRQFAHATWNGWTFADTIFPCFLFIVGVSLALSTSSRVVRGQSRIALVAHAIFRSLVIFACGVAIDYLRFPSHDFPFVGLQPHLQLTGALQKISLCYLAAFLIFLWTGLRGVMAAIIGLNLLYLTLLYFYPVPGCGPGSLVVTCNFPGYIDTMLLNGFRWNSTAFDPDGIGSILPAITSVLFGVVAGQLFLREPSPRQLSRLLGGGLALIAAGQLLSIWVPINKQLWTPSFAVFMAGIATVGLVCAVGLIEGRPSRLYLRPLEIFGSNAIAAYLLSRLVMHVPRVHIMGKSFYADVLIRFLDPPNASMMFAFVVLVSVCLTIWLMDQWGWHLKF
jgi:predicted acyltransferase